MYYAYAAAPAPTTTVTVTGTFQKIVQFAKANQTLLLVGVLALFLIITVAWRPSPKPKRIIHYKGNKGKIIW